MSRDYANNSYPKSEGTKPRRSPKPAAKAAPAKKAKASAQPAAKAAAPEPKGKSIWFGLFVGLVVGLFIAFLIFLRTSPNLAPAPVPPEVVPVPQAKTPTPPAVEAKAEPKETKPRFEFYRILPEQEVVVPDAELRQQQPNRDYQYILQIASFKKASEADSLKAELAFLGVETKVETLSVKGAIWHRVRSGPYPGLRSLEKDRRRIQANNLTPVLIKVPLTPSP